MVVLWIIGGSNTTGIRTVMDDYGAGAVVGGAGDGAAMGQSQDDDGQSAGGLIVCLFPFTATWPMMNHRESEVASNNATLFPLPKPYSGRFGHLI